MITRFEDGLVFPYVAAILLHEAAEALLFIAHFDHYRGAPFVDLKCPIQISSAVSDVNVFFAISHGPSVAVQIEEALHILTHSLEVPRYLDMVHEESKVIRWIGIHWIESQAFLVGFMRKESQLHFISCRIHSPTGNLSRPFDAFQIGIPSRFALHREEELVHVRLGNLPASSEKKTDICLLLITQRRQIESNGIHLLAHIIHGSDVLNSICISRDLHSEVDCRHLKVTFAPGKILICIDNQYWLIKVFLREMKLLRSFVSPSAEMFTTSEVSDPLLISLNIDEGIANCKDFDKDNDDEVSSEKYRKIAAAALETDLSILQETVRSKEIRNKWKEFMIRNSYIDADRQCKCTESLIPFQRDLDVDALLNNIIIDNPDECQFQSRLHSHKSTLSLLSARVSHGSRRRTIKIEIKNVTSEPLFEISVAGILGESFSRQCESSIVSLIRPSETCFLDAIVQFSGEANQILIRSKRDESYELQTISLEGILIVENEECASLHSDNSSTSSNGFESEFADTCFKELDAYREFLEFCNSTTTHSFQWDADEILSKWQKKIRDAQSDTDLSLFKLIAKSDSDHTE